MDTAASRRLAERPRGKEHLPSADGPSMSNSLKNSAGMSEFTSAASAALQPGSVVLVEQVLSSDDFKIANIHAICGLTVKLSNLQRHGRYSR